MDFLNHIETSGFAVPNVTGLRHGVIDSLYGDLQRFCSDKRTNPIYGRPVSRDLHLVDLRILRLILNDGLISLLTQALGPNLIVWRSRVFYKKPGAPEIGWHQDWGEFRGEEFGGDTPSIKREIINEKIPSLTVWVPMQDTTAMNGAMQMVPGSHQRQHPYDLVDFHQSAFSRQPEKNGGAPKVGSESRENSRKLGAKIDPNLVSGSKIQTLEIAKGQPLVFTERTLHRSLPNQSPDPRIAINFRITTSDALIYPQRLNGTFLDNQGLDISGHRNLLIAGTNLNPDNVVIDATDQRLWGEI